jgi:hypothetical protein
MFDTYLTRHETISRHTTVTENRAPTDESVKILRDMEERAEKKVLNSVRVQNTPVDMVIHTMRDYFTGDNIYACIFKINGHQKRVEYRAYCEKDKLSVAIGIRDAVAKEIANVICADALEEAFRTI